MFLVFFFFFFFSHTNSSSYTYIKRRRLRPWPRNRVKKGSKSTSLVMEHCAKIPGVLCVLTENGFTTRSSFLNHIQWYMHVGCLFSSTSDVITNVEGFFYHGITQGADTRILLIDRCTKREKRKLQAKQRKEWQRKKWNTACIFSTCWIIHVFKKRKKKEKKMRQNKIKILLKI